MSAPYLRTYDIRVQRSLPSSEKDCKTFHTFVQEAAERGREVLRFTAQNSAQQCEVDLQLRCQSCGKQAVHRFRRNVELKFPDAVFVQFVRRRA